MQCEGNLLYMPATISGKHIMPSSWWPFNFCSLLAYTLMAPPFSSPFVSSSLFFFSIFLSTCITSCFFFSNLSVHISTCTRTLVFFLPHWYTLLMCSSSLLPPLHGFVSLFSRTMKNSEEKPIPGWRWWYWTVIYTSENYADSGNIYWK